MLAWRSQTAYPSWMCFYRSMTQQWREFVWVRGRPQAPSHHRRWAGPSVRHVVRLSKCPLLGAVSPFDGAHGRLVAGASGVQVEGPVDAVEQDERRWEEDAADPVDEHGPLATLAGNRLPGRFRAVRHARAFLPKKRKCWETILVKLQQVHG